jgi:hypothetical protein
MGVQKTGEGIFENLSNYLIIDVRSPDEYAHAMESIWTLLAFYWGAARHLGRGN